MNAFWIFVILAFSAPATTTEFYAKGAFTCDYGSFCYYIKLWEKDVFGDDLIDHSGAHCLNEPYRLDGFVASDEYWSTKYVVFYTVVHNCTKSRKLVKFEKELRDVPFNSSHVDSSWSSNLSGRGHTWVGNYDE